MTEFGGAPETARCIEIVRAAAATTIMPRFRALPPGAIRAKTTPDDLVTDADLAAEAAMSAALARDFPDALIVGEEAVAADPALLDRLPDAELAFVIDPIDGTWNYAAGLATFGVILAVVVRGRTVLGLLYDPVMDDWVITRAGGGAWFERAGGGPARRLTLAGAGPLSAATGFASPADFAPAARARLVTDLAMFGRTDGLRCSCHEYRLLVQGRARFGLSGAAKVWDHAAGVLALSEAGGHARMLDGAAYTPLQRHGPLLLADDAALCDTLTDRFAWLLGTGSAAQDAPPTAPGDAPA